MIVGFAKCLCYYGVNTYYMTAYGVIIDIDVGILGIVTRR